MKAIIFGVSGQDGQYMRALCERNGTEVVGISRSSGNWKIGSVENYLFVESIIGEYKPDLIFHLAANSTTKHEALFENHSSISTGTLNILEAAWKKSPQSKIFITGSGVQFRNSGRPIHETDPFEARDPYSVSRIHSVYAARYYRSLGLKTYVGYLFHHESELRKLNHVSMMIARAAAQLKLGKAINLQIGDSSVAKEWGYAGDIVKGIFTLVSQDKIFEACIGTGLAYTIENWLEQCFQLVGANWKDHVTIKSSFKPEYQKLVSDPSTVKSLNWKPECSFSDLSKMLVESQLQ
jgi:GDPmannose 4,6-dehydratase